MNNQEVRTNFSKKISWFPATCPSIYGFFLTNLAAEKPQFPKSDVCRPVP